MIKVSWEKSEFHEGHEVVFWDEEKQETVSPSLIMSYLQNNHLKIIRKFVGRHNPHYATFMDYDYYLEFNK